MSKYVYDDHKARADKMIGDSLASTDSAVEKVAILEAYRDAIAAFDESEPATVDPVGALPSPGTAETEASPMNPNVTPMPVRKGRKAPPAVADPSPAPSDAPGDTPAPAAATEVLS